MCMNSCIPKCFNNCASPVPGVCSPSVSQFSILSRILTNFYRKLFIPIEQIFQFFPVENFFRLLQLTGVIPVKARVTNAHNPRSFVFVGEPFEELNSVGRLISCYCKIVCYRLCSVFIMSMTHLRPEILRHLE